MYKLTNFLNQEGINATLISREIAPSEGIRVDDFAFVRWVRKFLNGGFFIDASILWVCRVFYFLRKQKEPFVLVSSAPPFGVSYIGFWLRLFKIDCFWIADFRDSWTLNPLYNPFPFGKLFSGFYERKVFESADLVIFNTPTDHENYCMRYDFLAARSLVVRNGFKQIISNSYEENEADKLRIIYSGGAYPRAMAARNVVNFIEQLNRAGCNAICDYFGEYDSVLSKSDFVNYRGKVRQDEVPMLLSNYRFGLIYLPEVCLDGGRVTQKFYDYIGSGVLPIVINPSKEMLRMMSKLQTGIVLFSKTDVRSAVPIIQVESKKKKPTLDEKLIFEFTNDYQFEKLLDYIGA